MLDSMYLQRISVDTKHVLLTFSKMFYKTFDK